MKIQFLSCRAINAMSPSIPAVGVPAVGVPAVGVPAVGVPPVATHPRPARRTDGGREQADHYKTS